MKGVQRSVILASVILAVTLGTVQCSRTPKGALVLEKQGSFFVGGDVILAEAVDIGAAAPGHITINQMYVEYMIPQGATKVPVVMLHGAGLSGKSYETTPDGRMGWDEYFVRKGHAVYVPDQVSRARSGFNQTIYNRVRAGGTAPSAQPSIGRTSDEAAWVSYRFGPTFGTAYSDEQFPTGHAKELSQQGIPTLNATLPTPDPNIKALSDLAVQLNGAVLMAHSQSGRFPLQAAVTNSSGTKGLIAMETSCQLTPFSDEDIVKLARVPILVVFGDHLDTQGSLIDWQLAFDKCQSLIARINLAHGNATMLHLPDKGLKGNSHMFMMDRNNLQVADLILKWMDENVK